MTSRIHVRLRLNPRRLQQKITVTTTNATLRDVLDRLTKEDGYLVWTRGGSKMANLLSPKVYDDRNYDLNHQLKEMPFGRVTLSNYYDLLHKVQLPSGRQLVVTPIQPQPLTLQPLHWVRPNTQRHWVSPNTQRMFVTFSIRSP